MKWFKRIAMALALGMAQNKSRREGAAGWCFYRGIVPDCLKNLGFE
jgi:hypothetical protein